MAAAKGKGQRTISELEQEMQRLRAELQAALEEVSKLRAQAAELPSLRGQVTDLRAQPRGGFLVAEDESTAKLEEEKLRNSKRGSVYHKGDEPIVVTWQGRFQYVLYPGLNENVPEVFIKIYEQYLDDLGYQVHHEEQLRSARSYERLQALLEYSRHK
jgi:hypothetical protein